MRLSKLIHLIFDLNAALDTGQYDDISMAEASEHIERENVVPWLRERVHQMDFSVLNEEEIAEYHRRLAEIHAGYAGNERRKWGVENRGLCLLIAWTAELAKDAER